MEGGICNFTPPEWQSALLSPQGRAPLPPPSHLALARVEICLMGFWGVRGLQLLAQEHSEHPLSPRPYMTSVPREPARLLLPACPGAAGASKPYSHPWLGERIQNLSSTEQGMESRRATPGHAPGPTGPCECRWAPALLHTQRFPVAQPLHEASS